MVTDVASTIASEMPALYRAAGPSAGRTGSQSTVSQSEAAALYAAEPGTSYQKAPSFNELPVNKVRFEVDSKTNQVVAKVVDNETGEVKTSIPSEEYMRVSCKIKEMSGLLVDTYN